MPRTRALDGRGRERKPKSESDISWRSTGRSPRALEAHYVVDELADQPIVRDLEFARKAHRIERGLRLHCSSAAPRGARSASHDRCKAVFAPGYSKGALKAGMAAMFPSAIRVNAKLRPTLLSFAALIAPSSTDTSMSRE
jgi:hypothetical protein